MSEDTMDKKTMIVFSPHPDDETLGMGGTIAKEVKRGNKILIVIMTDGRHAFSTMGINFPTPEEIGQIRRNEAKEALRTLGVPEENLFFLNFEDTKLEDNESLAEKQILALFVKYPPSEVYFTDKKDMNADHRATNRIVCNAVKKIQPKPKKYQYSICQPKSRISRGINYVSNFLQSSILYVNISDYISLKKAAINEYKSQTTIVSARQSSPILSLRGIEKRFQDYETFYKDK